MDDAQLRSLLLWTQSFQDKLASDVQVAALEDLCDGVFLSKIMHHIDPDYLKLEQISELAAGNWALCASNLKTLVRAVELYYNEELGQLCSASELVDTTRIARENDVHEVGKLVELILGCAVQCPNKSDYILPIMQMDASEQASIMHMIEGLMRRFQQISPAARRNSMNMVHSPSFGESSESAQLAQALEKASALELKYLDIERENRALTDRFENALAEHRQLAEKYAALEEERDKLVSERQSTLTRDNKKIQQIVEGEIHGLTLALEEKNEELQRVKRESTERLMVLENEVRRQADELDISRSKLGQMAKLETSVNKYKKKLEEMSALRTQVKELETHNAQYLDKVLDLESTIKTMPTLKALVEKYKNQVVELETANVEATSSLRIKDEKNRRLQEELDSALGGKEFLEQQVDELRSQLANLQHHHAAEDDFSSDASMGVGAGSLSADVLLGRDAVATLRERVARLERENAELRSGSETPDQTRLANELDFALKAKESLQNTVYHLQMQNEQLSEELRSARNQPSQPRALIEASGPQPMDTTPGEEGYVANDATAHMGVAPRQHMYASGPEAVTVYQNNMTPGTIVKHGDSGLSAAQVAEYEAQINRLKDEAEAVASMRATVTELTNRLKEKESMINEIVEQRTKLENYTKKTLHAVQTKYMVAVSSHRNQLSEKDERLEFLEKKLKEVRASYSREQALMMSSFYEIGTEMQRRTMMPQGPGAGPGAGSWLASKRTEERAKRRQL